jgi:hypothetical protein
LVVGRHFYFGSAKPNPTNLLAPYGTVEGLNITNLRQPRIASGQLHLPSPPTKLIGIDNSEFRIVALGANAELAPGSYIIPARFTGTRYIAQAQFTTTNRYTDIVIQSTFKGVMRNHTLYAATSSEISILSIRESDLLIQPVLNTANSAIRMPLVLFDRLVLSPGGSYLYAAGKDPSIDYGMLFAYDIRTTPKIVGFFGEYGFLPSRFIATNTKFVMANNATIIANAQMSTYTGAP